MSTTDVDKGKHVGVLKTKNSKYSWLTFSIITITLWGTWGALISIPEQNNFPAELGFIMWALSMIVPAFFALKSVDWKLNTGKFSIIFGSIIGLLGGVGQLILYSGAIANGPAYLIFPIIALAPVVTIIMSLIFLKERAGVKGWLGIALAIIAVPFLNYSEAGAGGEHSGWLIFALLVFLAWGVQGYFIKYANEKIEAESIFFYMALTSLLLCPVAWLMVDTPMAANWHWDGAGLAFTIGLLNSFGALFLVFAFRYGKAIVVSPLVNCLPPIITSILSLIILSVLPTLVVGIGMLIALISAYFLAFDES
jgi:drug/metabolite transporter (DMT)-like permease